MDDVLLLVLSVRVHLSCVSHVLDDCMYACYYVNCIPLVSDNLFEAAAAKHKYKH